MCIVLTMAYLAKTMQGKVDQLVVIKWMIDPVQLVTSN